MSLKKQLITAVLAVAALTTHAQLAAPGVFTLQPKAGMAIARITGDGSEFKAGLAAGVEAQYQIKNWLAVSTGLMYEQWGVISDVTPVYEGTELTVKTEYLLVPVMARFYVVKGLSIGVGLQTGFMTKAKAKLIDTEDDAKEGFNKVDLTIPVSIAYELPFGLTAEARFSNSLTNTFKKQYTGLSGYKVDKNHNQVIELTVGYKFKL